MRIDLNINHVNKLFELTELHMEWFTLYYPDNKPDFATLLRMNHKRILNYMIIDKLGKYTDQDIEEKFERMFMAYNSLFEITRMNREYDNKVIINHLTY